MNPSDDKKITVLGLGGVGGYLGALLADTYPHVSFVARGARGASIREKGLTLRSDYRGGRTVRPERVVETAAGLHLHLRKKLLPGGGLPLPGRLRDGPHGHRPGHERRGSRRPGPRIHRKGNGH